MGSHLGEMGTTGMEDGVPPWGDGHSRDRGWGPTSERWAPWGWRMGSHPGQVGTMRMEDGVPPWGGGHRGDGGWGPTSQILICGCRR